MFSFCKFNVKCLQSLCSLRQCFQSKLQPGKHPEWGRQPVSFVCLVRLFECSVRSATVDVNRSLRPSFSRTPWSCAWDRLFAPHLIPPKTENNAISSGKAHCVCGLPTRHQVRKRNISLGLTISELHGLWLTSAQDTVCLEQETERTALLTASEDKERGKHRNPTMPLRTHWQLPKTSPRLSS